MRRLGRWSLRCKGRRRDAEVCVLGLGDRRPGCAGVVPPSPAQGERRRAGVAGEGPSPEGLGRTSRPPVSSPLQPVTPARPAPPCTGTSGTQPPPAATGPTSAPPPPARQSASVQPPQVAPAVRPPAVPRRNPRRQGLAESVTEPCITVFGRDPHRRSDRQGPTTRASSPSAPLGVSGHHCVIRHAVGAGPFRMTEQVRHRPNGQPFPRVSPLI
jgi:hypothetical protein